MKNIKDIALDNAANAIALVPTAFTAIDSLTGGALTLGTGLAASTLKEVISKRHNYFEKELRRITNENNLILFLQKIAEDEELQSYFSEYIVKNCQTPSIRARNAMIIICKKIIDGEENLNHFTKTAMNTLIQLTDEDIEVFLVATDEEMLIKYKQNIHYILYKKSPTLTDKNFIRREVQTGHASKKENKDALIYGNQFLINDIQDLYSSTGLSINQINFYLERLIKLGALSDYELHNNNIEYSARYKINEYTRKLRQVLLEEQQYFS